MESLAETVPSLPTGVTWLVDGMDRSTAPHQLVLAQQAADPGEILWIDARDIASTYALYPATSRPGVLDGFRIARAWTAYQHHTLVRRAIEQASTRTRLIVVPYVCSLYRDDDLAESEANHLLGATLTALSELADARAVPVLLTAPPQERTVLEDVVDHELRCERTDQGYVFSGDSYRTTLYHGQGWWQTTIPYWVELLGAVCRGEDIPWPDGTAGIEAFA